MRIAVFTDLYLDVAGGIPSSISAQKNALTKLGHTVVIFCPGKPDSTEVSNNKKPDFIIDCKDFEKNPKSGIVLLPSAAFRVNGATIARWPNKIVDFIDKNFPNFKSDFDLIHSHYEAGASIAAVIIAKKYSLPLVQTMHGREDMAISVNVPHPFKTFAGTALNAIHKHYLSDFVDIPTINRDSYLANTTAKCKMWELMVRQANCADQVITPTKHFADKLEHYGVSKPISVVSNGVADNLIDGRDYKVRKLSPGEPLKIIWTSRLSREKRILPFLEAIKLLKERTSNFFLTVISDGNDFKRAKKYVSENDLNSNVKFLGAVPHVFVLEALTNQHLSIINSNGFDTQGLTTLEAEAAGLPVIYCDKDMDGVVIPGAGKRAKDASPEAMCDLIFDIINHPEQIVQMSKVCFSKRSEVFQSTQIKNLLKVYEKALK